MDKKTKFIALVVTVIFFVFLFRWAPLSSYLTQENVLSFLEAIRGKWWGPVVFILIYSFGCVIALPGSALTLAGGAVFGTFWGTLYNVIASNLGATLAFLAARYLGRDFIQGFLKTSQWASLDDKIGRSGFKTIFRLRLIPVIPFNGLNFGAGFSSICYRDYLFGSMLGMLPATLIYTYFADALLKGVQGASQRALMNLAVAGTLLILISFFPSILKKLAGAKTHGRI